MSQVGICQRRRVRTYHGVFSSDVTYRVTIRQGVASLGWSEYFAGWVSSRGYLPPECPTYCAFRGELVNGVVWAVPIRAVPICSCQLPPSARGPEKRGWVPQAHASHLFLSRHGAIHALALKRMVALWVPSSAPRRGDGVRAAVPGQRCRGSGPVAADPRWR